MSLIHIVKARGGDVYGGGKRASIPAPGHSRQDRSASLMIGHTGKVIAFSFGGATAFEILDDLKGTGLIDANGYPSRGGGTSARIESLSEAEKRRRAEDLWSGGVAIAGTPTAKYLRFHRVVRRNPATLGSLLHHPNMPLAVYGTIVGAHRPALMSLIRSPDGRPTAIEATYLDANADRDRRLRLSRKTIGVVPPGSFVAIDFAAEEMVVGEGVMTTISASEHFLRPAHALLGIRNLRSYRPAACVRSIIIAADRGTEGEAAAETLREILVSIGVTATVHLPPEQFRDFNQMAQAIARSQKKRGREGGG